MHSLGQGSFSRVMLAVSRLIRIKKAIGSKVISESRFNNAFDYFWIWCYEEVGNLTVVLQIFCQLFSLS